MISKIENKRVFITGGARGIGGAAVQYFVEQGARVVSVDIRDEEGEELARQVNAKGPGSVVYRHMDVTDLGQIKEAVDFAAEHLGGLDVIINVAGIAPVAPAEAIPEKDWDMLLAINVKGLHYVCAAAFPYLKDKGGVIINFGSDAGLLDDPVQSCAYSASKGAVISYSRSLAKEWAPYRIRVNTLNPTVESPLEREVMATLSPEEKRKYRAKIQDAIPLGGKLGDAYRDVAPVLAFLASEDSAFITSQIIPVNGGLAYTR